MTAKNIAIIGSAGAIGSAFTQELAERYPEAYICAFARNTPEQLPGGVRFHCIDYTNESSIAACAAAASAASPLDLVVVATGILHEGEIKPEKSLRDLSAEKFQRLFAANTVAPALLAKHFVPKLNRDERAVFAALSARVGSISDNRLGGWYAYRASKAALNMVLKNVAIETRRQNKGAIIVGLQPGTVDSELSKPFQGNVPEGQLFTPTYAARQLLNVLDTLKPEQSGKCFDFEGLEVEP